MEVGCSSSGSNGEKEVVGGRRWEWVGNFQRDLLAGAVMGGVVHTVVAPIERAKLLLQTQESNAAIVGIDGRSRKRRFRGMVDCLARTVKEEGALALWRGNGTGVIRYYPSVALNFSFKVSSFLAPPPPPQNTINLISPFSIIDLLRIVCCTLRTVLSRVNSIFDLKFFFLWHPHRSLLTRARA